MSQIIILDKHQSKAEIRQWGVDFTLDLQTGVTVSSATATHIPPSGTPTTPVVRGIVDNVVQVQLGPVSVTGEHVLSVIATYSNGEKSEVRLKISVDF